MLRERERWRKMTWMTTKVEMSFRSLRVSGSEISWHLSVSFLYFLLHQRCDGGHTHAHTSALPSFLPHFVPKNESLDSMYSSCIECQKYSMLLGILSQLRQGLGQIIVPGWICTLLLYVFPHSRPISQTEREGKILECLWAMSESRAGPLLMQTYLSHTSLHGQLMQGETKRH